MSYKIYYGKLLLTLRPERGANNVRGHLAPVPGTAFTPPTVEEETTDVNAISPDLHLSPAETAKRLGVSTKALRLYERHGLVTPLRSVAGWRVYGPSQMAQLHQVLALKRLGVPLAQIGRAHV